MDVVPQRCWTGNTIEITAMFRHVTYNRIIDLFAT